MAFFISNNQEKIQTILYIVDITFITKEEVI